MRSAFRRLGVLVAVGVLAAVFANPAAAQYYCPQPVVSYYAPPVVSYYAPPVVSYYAPPAVAYYQPVYPTTVTTFQGILPWRRTTVATYGAPAYVAPAPVVSYYTPRYVWR
jgi:hypothetical protein